MLLHVVTSVGFIGAVAVFLCLAITGLVTADPELRRSVYVAAGLITWDIIVPLAWLSLLIGILQSLGTPWGLFRYYWVIIKLALTVLATIVLMIEAQTVGLVAELALKGDVAAIGAPRAGMILHGAGGIAVLIVALILSIYKPRGMTMRGVRASQV